MIKKTLIYALILFLLYNILLYIWSPSSISPQGFWQDNQVKAQNYLYTDTYDNAENIIVGSSMSFRIPTDSLPNFCNLSLLGENYIKGLELMKEKGIYPKRVFIETNFPAGISKEGLFYDVLYNPVLYPIRTHLPSLRDGKQPILITASAIEEYTINHYIDEKNKDKYSAIFQKLSEPTPGIGLFQGFESEASSLDIKKQLDDLNTFIIDLESHNTEVIFFEMPFYKTLDYSPRVESIRKEFKSYFSPEKYIYLPKPAHNVYQTLDGLHLGRDEAKIFTSKFKMQVDSLILAGK